MDLGQQVVTEPNGAAENACTLLLEKYGTYHREEKDSYDVTIWFKTIDEYLETLVSRYGIQITMSEIVQYEREMRRRSQLPKMKDLRQWLLIAQQARRDLEHQKLDPELLVSSKSLCMGLRLWAHYRTYKVTDIQASYCV